MTEQNEITLLDILHVWMLTDDDEERGTLSQIISENVDRSELILDGEDDEKYQTLFDTETILSNGEEFVVEVYVYKMPESVG